MTIESQEDQNPEQDQYEDQAPAEDSYEDQTEVVSHEPEAHAPVETDESFEPEASAPADESGNLARMVSQLDPVIQRELWSKVLSYAQQRIPAETALHLAARAIEDELRKYF